MLTIIAALRLTTSRTTKLTTIVGLLLCVAAGPVSADLLVGNLAQGNQGGESIVFSDTDRLANAFTTPATLPSNVAVLESIDLGLIPASGFPTATISLWTDNTGSPGTSLGIGFNSQLVSTSGTYSFIPMTTFLFDPSTKYWVVLQEASSATYLGWGFGTTQDSNSVPGATIGNGNDDSAFSSDSGATWGFANGPYLFAVNGTAVPEPPVVLLFALGLAGIMLNRQSVRAARGRRH